MQTTMVQRMYSPQISPTCAQLYSFDLFFSILLVNLCWSILSSLIKSSPRLSWAPTFGLSQPVPPPPPRFLFPASLLSPYDPPNWLWRHDCLILVCPVPTQNLPATWQACPWASFLSRGTSSSGAGGGVTSLHCMALHGPPWALTNLGSSHNHVFFSLT